MNDSILAASMCICREATSNERRHFMELEITNEEIINLLFLQDVNELELFLEPSHEFILLLLQMFILGNQLLYPSFLRVRRFLLWKRLQSKIKLSTMSGTISKYQDQHTLDCVLALLSWDLYFSTSSNALLSLTSVALWLDACCFWFLFIASSSLKPRTNASSLFPMRLSHSVFQWNSFKNLLSGWELWFQTVSFPLGILSKTLIFIHLSLLSSICSLQTTSLFF